MNKTFLIHVSHNHFAIEIIQKIFKEWQIWKEDHKKVSLRRWWHFESKGAESLFDLLLVAIGRVPHSYILLIQWNVGWNRVNANEMEKGFPTFKNLNERKGGKGMTMGVEGQENANDTHQLFEKANGTSGLHSLPAAAKCLFWSNNNRQAHQIAKLHKWF